MKKKFWSIVLVVCIAFSACASGKKDVPEKVIPDEASVEPQNPEVSEPPPEEITKTEYIFVPQQLPPPNGIYVGILEFGGTIKNITPKFVFFDPTGKQQLLDYIDSYYPLSDPGSAFYYAIHSALTSVDAAKGDKDIPRDAATTIIAITDGLEIGSTNPALPNLDNFDRSNFVQYQLYITQLLDEKKVNMALRPVKSAQNSSLANKTLNQSVAEIVRTVNSNSSASSPLVAFTVRSPVYPVGTQLRIVLDGQNAENSKKYIEGKVSRDGDTFKLIDVNAQGISLYKQPLEIPGEKSPMEVLYTIKTTDTFNKALAKQWYIQPTNTRNEKKWSADNNEDTITITQSELNAVSDVSIKKSAVVYLLLDGNTSLEKNIVQIRSEAKNIINQLYNEVSKPQVPPSFSPMVNQPVPPKAPTPPVVTHIPPKPRQPPVTPKPPKPIQPTSFPDEPDLPANVLLNDAWITEVYKGAYWIQVGAYQSQSNVDRLKRGLESMTYRVDTNSTVVKSGRSLHRIRIGPYSYADAKRLLPIIKKTVLRLPS
jgi:cell division septation protein DedD